MLVRFNRDGSLDGSFGVGGKVTTDLGAAPAIQPDGQILAAGGANNRSVGTQVRSRCVCQLCLASAQTALKAIESFVRSQVVPPRIDRQKHQPAGTLLACLFEQCESFIPLFEARVNSGEVNGCHVALRR